MYEIMIQLYQKINTLKVLSHFFNFPFEGFYLRELSRLLDMDSMTVKRSLDLLVDDGFLKKYHEKNMILYKSCMDNPHFTFAKVSHNLSLIYESRLVEQIMKCVEVPICIVIYGSVSKGDDGPGSDLDILIISNRIDISVKVEDLPWEFNPVIMDLDGWTSTYRSNRPFYDEVTKNGIVLHGTLPVME